MIRLSALEKLVRFAIYASVFCALHVSSLHLSLLHVYSVGASLPVYIWKWLLKQYLLFSGNFNCIVCLIVAFVCLLHHLHAMRELS